MSYRAPPMGDTVGQDVQRGIGFLTNPVGAVTDFLTSQVLGSIFGEDTHQMYLQWLGQFQAAQAAGRQRSRLAKLQIANAALRATDPRTRIAMRLAAMRRNR